MSFFSRLFGCKKPQPAPAPVPVQAKTHEVYDLRHIKDINNIVYYDTCSMPENKTFQRLLEKHFADCDVRQAVAAADLFPHAPAYAMPVNFLLTKDDKQLAIFLLDVRYVKRYSYLETRELCMENGIPFKEAAENFLSWCGEDAVLLSWGDSDLQQLEDMVNGDVAIGRKLDFLVQEINREANTIGSKCNDVSIAQVVIGLKAEVEKMREQVQNVE